MSLDQHQHIFSHRFLRYV